MGHTKKKETTTPSTIRPQDFKKRKGHLEGYCELRSAAASPNSRPLPTTFLSTREGTSLPIKRNSTYICEHVNSLASKSTSSLALKGNSMFLDNLKLRSHLCPQAPPPPPTTHPPALATLINCMTKPLMDLGISGFHDLTSANIKYIVSGKQLRNKYTRVFKKHIIALN